MRHIISRILENISFNDKDYAIFDNSDREVMLLKENFYNIEKNESRKRVAFIDGGNLEILRSPSLSLFFNRLYYTIYLNNKRETCKMIEFYTLISALNRNGKLYFRAEPFFTVGNLSLREYEFDSFDATLVSGARRAQISVVGDVMRRFAELEFAKEISNPGIIIILDGTLEATYTYEEHLLESIKGELCAVSKTLSLLTRSGNSLSASLAKMADKKEWYYFLTDKRDKKHNASIYLAKLFYLSEHILRIDARNCNIKEIISILAENSRDPVFPGYPYGLIEADRFARVSLRERESLQLQLKARMKSDFEKLKPLINSLNAHELLDSIG